MTAVFYEYGTHYAFVTVDGNHSTEARVYPNGLCGNKPMVRIAVESIFFRTENTVVVHMNNGKPDRELSVVAELNLETLRLAAELLGYSLKKME